MRFEYKKYFSGGTVRTRPVIAIGLENLAGTIKLGYEVLVDSGSDICIFDQQIGELLGFKFGANTRAGHVRGVTGVSEEIHRGKLKIKVGGESYKIDTYFLPMAEGDKYGIVGQAGFFDLFTVKFDLIKEQIEIKSRG